MATVYAHRGACFELPDNTIPSFELALRLGADALETDAHMTRDGHIVLSHDPSGAKTAGIDKPISSLSLDELRLWDVGTKFVPRRPGVFRANERYRIPTLEETLATFPDTFFNIDAKQTEPDMVPALLRVIRAAKAEKRVRIASFSAQNLARVRATYEGETGLASSEVARFMLLPKLALKKWLRPGGDAAQVPRRAYGIAFDTARSIARLHALGLRVDFWTIDDPTEAARLFALGADGIMTDDPRTVCAAQSSS